MKLGNAVRDSDKAVRVASHIPVLQLCCETFSILDVTEDGMGNSSTPFFHSCGAQRLLSFETREEWAQCPACEAQNIEHHIGIGDFCKEDVQKWGYSNQHSLLFVDGLHADRIKTLEAGVELHFALIVEHDVESLNQVEKAEREWILSAKYDVYQYVGRDPETLLAVRKDLLQSYMLPKTYIKL